MSDANCKHCGRPEGGIVCHDEGGNVLHLFEPQDWADQHTDEVMAAFYSMMGADSTVALIVRQMVRRAVREALAKAAEVVVGAAAVEEAAKGLVESPEWDYDGADEVEKDYYRRFAAKCLARVVPAIRALGAR